MRITVFCFSCIKCACVSIYNCTYSPRTADVDFGLITPRGTFVFVEGEDGSCNQTIQVSQTGDYYFAVRNNSSNDVEVLGYAYYY